MYTNEDLGNGVRQCPCRCGATFCEVCGQYLGTGFVLHRSANVPTVRGHLPECNRGSSIAWIWMAARKAGLRPENRRPADLLLELALMPTPVVKIPVRDLHEWST